MMVSDPNVYYTSPYFGQDVNKNVIFIKYVPKNLSKQDLTDKLRLYPGFLHLNVSNSTSLDFSRIGWAVFDSLENMKFALSDMEKRFRELNPCVSVS